MGRHNSLSGGDPKRTTHLIASHRSGQEENCSKVGLAGSPPEQEKLSLYHERSPLLYSYKQLIRPVMEYACPPGGAQSALTSGSCRCCNPSVSALLRAPLCTLVTGRFTRIGVPIFADHIRALSVRFDSKLADVGNSLVR
jgi:hypothetical protein